MQLLFNASIYTQNPAQPITSAILIDGGHVLAVGDKKELLKSQTKNLKAIDLQGATILPGLTDAHIHLEQYSLFVQKVDCETATKQACLQRIADRANLSPQGVWILGHGWNHNLWQDGYGTATDLDQVAPHNPVYLTAKSLHAAWVNTRAIQEIHLDTVTHDPTGGQIRRNNRGEPTGILLEGAMALAEQAIPPPSVKAIAEAICTTQPRLWQMGITGVHDFDKLEAFAALQILRESNILRLRVIKSLPFDFLPQIADLHLHSGFGDEFLQIGSLKAFADGALGPRTAAMLHPYEGESFNNGLLFINAGELYEKGKTAVENNLSLAIHAIGDRANREIIEGFKQLRILEIEIRPHQKMLRHRIEHVQIIHPDDIPYFAQLNLIASMQPLHAPSDYQMADRYWGQRAHSAYAWKSLLDHKIVLAFGSDAPVESPNPFSGLHAAMTRRREDGSPGPRGWYPEQRLNFQQALDGFTTGPAYAAGRELNLGKLAPGFHADLIVLEKDPFTVDPDEIRKMESSATMVAGDWVYVHPDFNDLLSSGDSPPLEP
jgi:predicted amidohydrolase YtcJ